MKKLPLDIKDYTIAAIKSADKNLRIVVGRRGPEGVSFLVKHNREDYVITVSVEDGWIRAIYPGGRVERKIQDVDKYMADIKELVKGWLKTALKKSA
ncbi:hypothetical protein KY329_04675 [Candidatus Woesearchaeota archaeon]|nr:hypothetical protein [Candidatus Woesearchaeota archaeon]